MKYFFVSSTNNSTYIIVANTEENAEEIAKGSGLDLECLYEMKEDTFSDEGFLMTWDSDEERILSRRYQKLTVINLKTEKEIAVITDNRNTPVTTASGDIIVELTPYHDSEKAPIYKELKGIIDFSDIFAQMRYMEEQTFTLLGEWNKSHVNSDTEQVRKNLETMILAWHELRR